MKTLINQQYFISTDVLRVHKGIAMEFKFKARNQNANDIDSATNSMRNTLYKLIHNNRNNTTQEVYIGITEHFSKPEGILIAKDLVDLLTGIIHKRGAISIPTNERVYDDKYHHSNVFTLYPTSSIRKLLDDLTTPLTQNQEDNMARLEGASNHKLQFIDNIYIKSHETKPFFSKKFCTYTKKIS